MLVNYDGSWIYIHDDPYVDLGEWIRPDPPNRYSDPLEGEYRYANKTWDSVGVVLSNPTLSAPKMVML